MSIKIRASVLSNSNNVGTVCTKEMEQRNRTNPRYGTILWIVEGLEIDGHSLNIDRYVDIPRVKNLHPGVGVLEECRLIVEMSVYYRVDPSLDRQDVTWNSMLQHLTTRQQYVTQLQVGLSYQLEMEDGFEFVLPSRYLRDSGTYESEEQVAERFTRLSSGNKFMSFIVKCQAVDVDSIKLSPIDTSSPYTGPIQARNFLLGLETIPTQAKTLCATT